jgi:signal transduction histidine kinase
VRNLINNAIKFSPEGAVVKVSAVNFKGMLRIVVEDSGLGIKKYRLSTIFEGYRDASQSENRSTRLGLMLCKDLCTRNNGDISIESEEGQGTKVLVDMPTEKHFKLFNKSKKLLATRFTMPHRKDTSKKKTSKPIN